ncbi:MAG TPA: hypothetical protein G4O02_18865 [Caldilineae bacterium]|nr:hypothetical protein [Caldilineae bacterium]
MVTGLKKIAGVQRVRIVGAYKVLIYYDPQQTNEEELLATLVDALEPGVRH